MTVKPWENPHKCCVLIKAKEEHSNINPTKQELMNAIESLTIVLRDTEHNNCSMCLYKNTYGKTGQCVKRSVYNRMLEDRDHLKNSLNE